MFGRRTKRYFCRLRKNPPVAFKQSEQEKGRRQSFQIFIQTGWIWSEWIYKSHPFRWNESSGCSVSVSDGKILLWTGRNDGKWTSFFKGNRPFQIKKTSYHVQWYAHNRNGKRPRFSKEMDVWYGSAPEKRSASGSDSSSWPFFWRNDARTGKLDSHVHDRTDFSLLSEIRSRQCFSSFPESIRSCRTFRWSNFGSSQRRALLSFQDKRRYCLLYKTCGSPFTERTSSYGYLPGRQPRKTECFSALWCFHARKTAKHSLFPSSLYAGSWLSEMYFTKTPTLCKRSDWNPYLCTKSAWYGRTNSGTRCNRRWNPISLRKRFCSSFTFSSLIRHVSHRWSSL